MVLICFFTFHVVTLRPYRCFTSNIIYALAMIGLCIQMIFMYAKVSGYKQSIFVDKYFWTLNLMLNGFTWFLVFTAILFTITSRSKWPIDAEEVFKLTEGQAYSIFLIKESRKYQVDLLRRKKYSEADSLKIADLLMKMTLQFQQFKDKSPIILDSLLETIDSLRLMQKK